MKPLVTNAADEEQVKESKLHEKFSRETELSDVAHVLSSPQGRRFYWRLLTECKTFESIMTGSAYTYYNSGKQDLGHYLLGELNAADPEAYLKMLKEIKGVKNV